MIQYETILLDWLTTGVSYYLPPTVLPSYSSPGGGDLRDRRKNVGTGSQYWLRRVRFSVSSALVPVPPSSSSSSASVVVLVLCLLFSRRRLMRIRMMMIMIYYESHYPHRRPLQRAFFLAARPRHHSLGKTRHKQLLRLWYFYTRRDNTTRLRLLATCLLLLPSYSSPRGGDSRDRRKNVGTGSQYWLRRVRFSVSSALAPAPPSSSSYRNRWAVVELLYYVGLPGRPCV